jgi:dolichol-phosphate mannosyltransferase
MRAVAVIPTYNEAGNIVPLIREVLRQGAELEALVVDDNSPDGTGRLVREEAERNPRIHLLLRTRDRGRGSAGLAGFAKAIEMGAERIVEMDADFSHDPAHLPALLRASDSADIAIGSRFVPGGRDEERGFSRRAVSRFARTYLRRVLGLAVKDPTSGYRCFRREALAALMAAGPRARDPFIVAELLFLATRRGMRIVEVPIVFRNRREGSSKLHARTLLGYCVRALRLRLSAGGIS